MKFFLLIAVLFCYSCQTSGQELKRRAFLGVQVEASEPEGLLVQRVVDNSSGAQIGLQVDDILVKLQGSEISSVDAFISEVSAHFEGDEISLEIVRNGEDIELTGTLLGRAKELPKLGTIEYRTVAYEGGRLRSLLNLPPGVKNPPVVYFIQGYSCRTIDIYWNGKNRLRQIVDGLVAKGFAVYRIEKPGMGDSQTEKSCNEIGYHEEAAAFLAGLRDLKTIEKVDEERVFLFGHSLGGVTAPVIAAEEQVRGIINYGSVTSSWFEFLVKRAREHGRLRGDDPREVEEYTRELIPFLQDYLVARMPEHELQNKHSEYLQNYSTPYMGNRAYSFMQELEEIDITQCLIRSNAPVLAIHAEADFNCVDGDWAKHTEYVVNSVRPGQGQWKLLPETSHSFAKVGDLETFMRLRANGEITNTYVDSNFNPELIKMIAEWIEEVERV